MAVFQRLGAGHPLFVLVFIQFFINRMLLLQVIGKRLLRLPIFSMSLLHLIDAVYDGVQFITRRRCVSRSKVIGCGGVLTSKCCRKSLILCTDGGSAGGKKSAE